MLPVRSIIMKLDYNDPKAFAAVALLLLLSQPTFVTLVRLAWLPLTRRLLFSHLIIFRECMGT
jgi:hypothetical protein